MRSDLATLVGSRICHDLISPIGAIGNGVELLGLTGSAQGGAEMDLIADSVRNATARIQFFRVAFGAAPRGQTMPRRDLLKILADLGHGARISHDWQADGDALRSDIRNVFLLLLCCETAMIQGGEVRIKRDGPRWTVVARAPRLKMDADLWAGLTDARVQVVHTAAQVQFALLPVVLFETNSSVSFVSTDTTLTARLSPA